MLASSAPDACDVLETELTGPGFFVTREISGGGVSCAGDTAGDERRRFTPPAGRREGKRRRGERRTAHEWK